MPRLYIPEISKDGEDYTLGLWKMTDIPSSLIRRFSELRTCAVEMYDRKSEVKRLEYISVRALLLDMKGYLPEISHDENGKPLISDGEHISISHTRGYAAVIVSDKYNVAVDIEFISDRVCRVSNRFLRDDESADSVLMKIVSWCAKETLYKLHSSDRLGFHDMRIGHIKKDNGVIANSGQFYIENLKRQTRVLMSYVVTDMFVITFAVEKSN